MKRTIAMYGIQDKDEFPYPGFTHDHAICIMEDGVIKDYLHLERYSRRKYDNRMHLFIEDLIQQGIVTDDGNTNFVFVNSFIGNAFISPSGRIRFEANQQDEFGTSMTKGRFYFQKGWDGKSPEAWLISHELAHIGSCLPFFGAYKENSLLLHFDGGASLGNFSAIHYKNGLLTPLECHWELSKYSKFFNDNALTFSILDAKPGEHCSVAGKLMGYAALGTFRPEILDWLRSNGYFKMIWEDKSSFYQSAEEKFGWKGDISIQEDVFLMDIAAAFQYEFQQKILKKIKTLQQETSAEFLYYTGGCALNIVTNSDLINSASFKDVFIPPCCNDSGLAIGAAAFAQWSQGLTLSHHSPFLNTMGLEYVQFTYTKETIRKVAALLSSKNVIGVCNGAGEAGPRALGNRSILALADSKTLADKVSQFHKKREWFRPVAPMMLEHNALKVTGLDSIHHLADYMLLEFDVLPKFQKELEGVVHYNGTARIQVVRKEFNPFIYDLLVEMEEHYGHIALINTSFNHQGAPMVHTGLDAKESALTIELDALVLNGDLIKIKEKNNVLEVHNSL